MKAYNGEVVLDWESTGDGPPLLLIHGLGYARWGWGPLVPLLVEHFRVITFDNRGVGRSSVPEGPYTASEMARDALAVLDDSGAQNAHVAGTSLGGMIAQELAIAHPDRVERLVLLSTTPGRPDGYPMPEATVRLLEQASDWEPETALRRFVENALGPAPDPGLVDDILGHRLANPQDPAGWAAQAAAGTTYAGSGRCRDIAAPTLVMSGTEDRVVDHRNTHLLGEMIPRATVRLVEGSGHLLFWEHPRLVVNMIVEFLK